jgi:hypothetical protein
MLCELTERYRSIRTARTGNTTHMQEGPGSSPCDQLVNHHAETLRQAEAALNPLVHLIPGGSHGSRQG